MDARDKIIVKYGEKNPDGTSSVRDPDNLVKANDEIKELLVTEYEKDIVVIPETKTLDCGLNSEQLSCISWMIRRCDSNDIRELLGIEDVEQKEFDKKNADKYDPKEPINDPDFI